MKHRPLVIKSQGFVLDSSFNGREPKIACFPSLCVTTRDPIICEYQTATQKNTGHSKIQLSRSLDGEISCGNVDWCFDTRMHGVPGSLSNCEIVELDLSRLMLVSTWINRSEPHRPFFFTRLPKEYYTPVFYGASPVTMATHGLPGEKFRCSHPI